MFADAFESVLKDHCTSAVVRAIEAGHAVTPLIAAIADSGFLELLAEESDGGAGIAMHEFYPVAALCGAYAVPLPVAQTMAARLLIKRHETLPAGMITFSTTPLQQIGNEIVCARVPFAMVSDHIVVARDGALWTLPLACATREPTGVHGGLSATLRWSQCNECRFPSDLAGSLLPLAALLHAAMLAGAMKRAFDMTLQYGNDRVQFGKSIGKFQSIQHQLSVMAEHVAASSIAAEAGFQCGRSIPSLSVSAVAKSRTSEAAQLVASLAHAIHGAIGITAEYDLQLYTRRLHEWRMTHGSEAHWNRLLGQALLDSREPLIADFVRHIAA